MRTYLFASAVAAVCCGACTPLASRIAHRCGALSYPGDRHINREAVPRMGGLAIYLALVTALVVVMRAFPTAASSLHGHDHQVLGLFVGGTAIMVVGLVDDAWGLPARYKLLAQTAVALLAYVAGFQIREVSIPFGGTLSMGVFALPVTLVWIVGVINAVNLIDGLDGLAAGIVLFASLTSFVVALLSGTTLIAIVMAAVIGSLLGFLVFNFNPARIFMGDSGSYLLGYVLGASALVGSQKTSTAVSLLVPCLALGLPIFDTLFSIVRRVLERRPLFSPDRGHLHHRLMDMGLTHRRAVLILYGASATFSAAAIATWLGKEWEAGVALLASTVILFALIRFAGYVEYVQYTLRRRSRLRGPTVQALRMLLAEFPLLLAHADTEDQLCDELARAAAGIHAERMELRARGSKALRRDWQCGPKSRRDGDVATYIFPVGDEHRARAEIQLTLPLAGDRPVECELLSQLLVDMFAHALTRAGSSLAPRPPAAGSFAVTPPIRTKAVPATTPTDV